MNKQDLDILLARIEQRLTTDPATGCRLWQGMLYRDHGGIKFAGKLRSVHRVVWEHAHGPITSDQWVLHRCGVGNCANVEHLYIGDRVENARDRKAHGRYVGPFRTPSRVVKPSVELRVNAPHAPLTHEEIKRLVSYDAATGVMTWNARPDRDRMWNTRFAGKEIGAVHSSGYRYANFCGKVRTAHRLAWFWMTGEWPVGQVDHINRDRSDNRWENLRLATQHQNSANQGLRGNNTSGVTGVSWQKKTSKWYAYIKVGYQAINLGTFDTKAEAIAARRKAELKHFGAYSSQKGTD